MVKLKWIVGLIGWVAWGPIGALVGYFFGAFIDSGLSSWRQIRGGSGTGQSDPWQRTSTSRTYSAGEQRNSFMISLLVLSSAIIRADGRTHQAELNHVRNFIRQNFGADAVDDAMRILDGLNNRQVNIYEVGTQIADYMN